MLVIFSHFRPWSRVLRELPKATTVDACEALLPWNQLPIEVLTNELALLND